MLDVVSMAFDSVLVDGYVVQLDRARFPLMFSEYDVEGLGNARRGAY